jgi:hypothetical protein
VWGRRVWTVLFQRGDLLPQTVQDYKAAGDRQHLGLLGQQAREFLLRQCLHPFEAEACTRIPRPNVLHTEDIGGVLTDQVRAFA